MTARFDPTVIEYLSVETDGSVYVCGRFNHLSEFRMGNILTEPWDKIFTNKSFLQFNSRRQQLPDQCQQCTWLTKCWGGCTACARATKGDIYERTPWCESRKIIFSHVQKQLNKLMKKDKYGVTIS